MKKTPPEVERFMAACIACGYEWRENDTHWGVAGTGFEFSIYKVGDAQLDLVDAGLTCASMLRAAHVVQLAQVCGLGIEE